MKGELLPGGRGLRRVVHLAAASLSIAATGAVGGCLSRPLEPIEPKTTSVVVERLTESSVDKIDLLLAIDNSRSMADKQKILVEAVPDLVRGLVNPKCIDQTTMLPSSMQPNGPTDPCPDAASKRDFNPVLDIHIGIVSSSIGGHGSDACPNTETFSCPGAATNGTNNDAGHLLTRADPCTGGSVPSYQNKGFLAWDPKGKLAPPGEPNIGSIVIDPVTGNVTNGMPGLVSSLKDLVLGTGQIGCGYESQHEAWYRFLIEPSPYQSITIDAQGRANPMGIDNVLLQQRKDFLRPSSLLAVVALTDENDCSIKEYGQFYFVAQQRDPGNPNKNFYLPKPRSECATNPNDKCCRSCGQDQTGCPTDPVCATGSLDGKTDDVNLRCFDTKRRFGIDFLYPIDRYVQGLTNAQVPDRMGNLVANPIFSDLDPTDADTNVRDSSLVFIAYIAGVPWQDIAVDPTDLKKGLKTAAQLATLDKDGHTTWDYIIGDPDNYVKPLDPHMIESITPRSGTDPITGVTLAPTTAPAGTDAINGHEYTPGTIMGVQSVPDDLQYACIFDLPSPRDCSDTSIVSCDCSDPKNDNPLCEPDPSKGGNRTLQVRAKGYPGIRELQLIKAVGVQGIVGSICPAQLNDLAADDFGYRPAIGAIINRLKTALGGQCLPRQLTPNKTTGQVDCLILEARNSGGQCDCSTGGRQEVESAHQAAVQAAQADPIAKASNWDCFCEITQLTGSTTSGCTMASQATSPLSACQCDDTTSDPIFNGSQVDGWCYVDAGQSVGNAKIVEKCPDTEKRLVRFVGNGNPKPGATLFITCSGD
jgi:hypothetical protein